MAADPRQFTEHNTMGNVSVYLEDKRMEELKSATAKTSSQISTSAQYIPLQDTDGNLVKINPASFEEAVRNVLGGLLANNDKGTTISGLPALSGSGANLDFGSVTPTNLASVLGVKIETVTGNDLGKYPSGFGTAIGFTAGIYTGWIFLPKQDEGIGSHVYFTILGNSETITPSVWKYVDITAVSTT